MNPAAIGEMLGVIWFIFTFYTLFTTHDLKKTIIRSVAFLAIIIIAVIIIWG